MPITNTSRNYVSRADRPNERLVIDKATGHEFSGGEIEKRHIAEGWITRTRLLKKIDQTHGPIVIRAEAGAGKTTLVSQWIRHAGPSRPRAWVAFNEHDNNIIVAWRRLLHSIRALSPAFLDPIVADYRKGLLSPDELPGPLLACLLKLDDAVLVLEDLHVTSHRFQEQLCQVFRAVSNVRLVITTREPVAPETDAAFIATGLCSVSSTDLAFTYSEVHALLEHATGEEVSDLARQVIDTTRGHVLSTRLAVSHLTSKHGLLDGARPRQRSLLRVFADVERALPEFSSHAEERFSCAVALCPEVTPDLVATMAPDIEDPWDQLQKWEERGLGRIDVVDVAPVFRFHALVKAALLRHGQELLKISEARQFRRTAFYALARISDPIALFELALDSELDDVIFAFFAQNFSELSLVRSRECIERLEEVSEERMNRDWQLPLVYAVLLVEARAQVPPLAHVRAQTAMRHLRRVRVGLDAPAPLRALHALAWFAACRVSRQYEQSKKYVDVFFREHVSVIRQGGPHEAAGWSAAVLQGMITRALAGDVAGAIEAGGIILNDDSHHRRYLHGRSLVSFMHAVQGDLRESAQHLRAIEAAGVPQNWNGMITSVGAQLSHALQLANIGNVSRAISVLDEALPDLGELEFWPAVLWTRARIRFVAGDSEYGVFELQRSLEEVIEFVASRWWKDRLQVALAELHLATGAPLEAQRVLDVVLPGPDVDIVRAAIALSFGRLDDAYESIRELPVGSDAPVAARISAALLRAVVHSAQGDDQLAATAATSAMRMARLTNNYLPLSVIPASMVSSIRALVPRDLWREPISTPLRFTVTNLVLTRRELAILAHLRGPKTIGEIASEMFISTNTIKTHLRHIYSKLGVSSRSEAINTPFARSLSSIDGTA